MYMYIQNKKSCCPGALFGLPALLGLALQLLEGLCRSILGRFGSGFRGRVLRCVCFFLGGGV